MKYTYEENGQDGQPQIEITFDSDAKIEAIFVYNQAVDEMILVDLETFKRRHPSKYNFLQEKANEIIEEAFDEENEYL